MALCDNPLWLLSHIRHSFLAGDDTGNSELVLGSATNTEAKDAQIIENVLGFRPLPLTARLDEYEDEEIESDEEEDDIDGTGPRSLPIRQIRSGIGGSGGYMRP